MKYIGIKIYENLNWKDQTNDIAIKLHRLNALFHKIRNHVCLNNLKAIYFAIFYSHISYVNFMLGQNPNSILRITI